MTWVSEATTAGGLYVGATRGRYENTLHVVAEGLDQARDALVAALGRDRADRGLDAARARAEADADALAVAALGPPSGQPAPPPPKPEIDPANWRSVAELDADAKAVEARLALGLRRWREVLVVPDEERQQKDREDLAAAAEARARAAWQRAEAERTAARRPELVEAATADYFRARDDARTVEAGPGRLGRKAAKVEAAQARWAETARRWSDRQLPGWRWPDDAVRAAASGAAEQVVATALRYHRTEADREDLVATRLGLQVIDRAGDHQAATGTNVLNRARREALVAAVERDRARIARNRAVRAERAEAMAPEEVARADHARDALLEDLARQRQAAHWEKQARRAALHQHLSPHLDPRHLDRGGPDFGL